MDEKKPGKGRGAFILEMIKNQSARPRPGVSDSLETPSISSEQTLSEEPSSSQAESSIGSNIFTGYGRGKPSMFTRTVGGDVSESANSSSQTMSSAMGRGRGLLLDILKRKSALPQPNMPTKATTFEAESAGVLSRLSDLSVYDNPSDKIGSSKEEDTTAAVCRQGTSGTRIPLLANYIDLVVEPGKGLYQYEVKYSPDIDSRGLRRKLLNQHAVALGRTKTFDGMILYLPIKLPQTTTIYHSEHPMDGSRVTLTIIYKKQQSMSENVQFFNVLFGRIMRALSLVRIGRQNFNPNCAHVINQFRLEVWPGYVTAVNEYEGGLKLCLDAKHRVMRTQTVRDIITDIYRKRQSNYKDSVMNEIVGTSVLTRYNNKTYRIDDVAWDKTPQFQFSRNGEQISLIDYYKRHWNIEIQDKNQPLLIHCAKDRTSTGEKQEKMILLVPELSYAAGLTESIRSNFKIMKELDSVTKMSPNNRRDVINRFIQEIEKNDIAREILKEWGLRLNKDIVQFTGRRLGPEIIRFGNDITFEATGEWSNAAVRNPALRTPDLNNWHVLHTARDKNCVNEFLNMLFNVVKAINMQVKKPRITILRDDKTETYLQEIQNKIDNSVELIIIVFPSNRTDRYSAVKKVCCVHKPIPTQVIISKTISNSAKLKSVTEKIALQINCKLGGALWTVNLPLKNCMVCGIDVYHSGTGVSKKSVAGFISSLDNQLSKWHSRICLQANRQELMDMLQMCFTSAINAYHKYNGRNPDRIIIFRDGVGDGDLEYVAKYEVRQLLETFNRIETNYKPQLSVIIVQKRVNTRLFAKSRNGLENPMAGTIVDSCITRRNYYDFFLVPQSIRLGTVTPTHYIVIHDTSNLETDHMQRLTYKLCHLYYNWPGTIRVPAPCQYAHKLVYLIGQNIQLEPHMSLSNTLFYL